MSTEIDFALDLDIKIKYPKKYKVYILNDNYTSMDFVVDILTSVFNKTSREAEAIMLEVHEKDIGLCGVYTHEIAETKVLTVAKKAKDSAFPLKAIMEEE